MSNININEKAQIFFDGENDIEMELDCIIKNIFNDRLELEYPSDAPSTLKQYLCEGTPIDVKVFTPVGLVAFDSVVINSPEEESFVIEYAEDAAVIQRRNYSRYSLKTKLELESRKEVFVASTIDISGGGIKFFSSEDLEPEQAVKGKLYLRNFNTPAIFEGEILDNPSLQPDEYTLAFTNIDEKERDKIIKTCFDIDMQSRKKQNFD
ncbi:PilZ domain-containing protein [bacterium]|nr:PilZ domain-containing protein [bacterium]